MPVTLDRVTETPGPYANSRSPEYQLSIVVGTVSRGTLELRSRHESGAPDWDRWFDVVARQTLVRAAQAFADRVAEIPQVRAVVLDPDNVEPRLTTYIDRRDLDVRSRIYDVEFEVCRELNLVGLDFRVISMDNPACSIPEGDAGGSMLLYRRDSRDHAEHPTA